MKFYWKTAMINLFKFCLWLLSHHSDRVVVTIDLQSLKYLLCGPLKKKFTDLCCKLLNLLEADVCGI